MIHYFANINQYIYILSASFCLIMRICNVYTDSANFDKENLYQNN